MKRAREPHDDSSKNSRNRRSRPTPRWLAKQPDLDAVARNRVLLVLSVLSGEKPVTSAIEESGISRGFYYQLETKALNAMLLALAPGADGEASPDATGLHQRIKDLEEKLARAEQATRRSERLLFVQRKLTTSSPVKTRRGRPPATKSTAAKPTRSTRAGRKSWRSSTPSSTTSASTSLVSPKPTVNPAPTPSGTASIPTPGGENGVL